MLDTAPIIYYIEEDPIYAAISAEVLNITDKNHDCFLFSSVITLTEVLIAPMRKKNDEVVESYKNILLNSGDFMIYPVDSIIAEKAAELRAVYNIKTPDALQLAVGIENDATLFVTNDKELSKVKEIEIFVLKDFL